MEQVKDKIVLTTFTDPMMGLSYECEPIYRKLETHFPDTIDFRYIMSVLVRDVYRLVDPADLALGKEIAIRRYNRRLAKIYESEEAISGMPINMSGFALFSPAFPSSIPLNLAYKAAQLTNMERADLFLYHLRYATIVECRPTTRLKEIFRVVKLIGLDEETFLNHYYGGTAQAALDRDLEFGDHLGIRTLPSCLLQYRDRSLLIRSLADYPSFVSAIDTLTEGAVQPQCVTADSDTLRSMLQAHPLISPIEVREALDLDRTEAVLELINPMLATGEAVIHSVSHGWFIEKKTTPVISNRS